MSLSAHVRDTHSYIKNHYRTSYKRQRQTEAQKKLKHAFQIHGQSQDVITNEASPN